MIPETQKESWEKLSRFLGDRHKQVLKAIEPQGSTLFELKDKLKLPTHYISGRLTELSRKGKIFDSGERKINPNSNKRAIVWKTR